MEVGIDDVNDRPIDRVRFMVMNPEITVVQPLISWKSRNRCRECRRAGSLRPADMDALKAQAQKRLTLCRGKDMETIARTPLQLGNSIRERRRKLGLSQEQLGAKVGVRQRT